MKAVSLFDLTGNILKPWAEAGYECYALDIQHPGIEYRDGIYYCHADLRNTEFA